LEISLDERTSTDSEQWILYTVVTYLASLGRFRIFLIRERPWTISSATLYE
jgi:hypothetical protein